MEARETPHVTGRLAGKVAIIGGAGSIGPGWGNGKASATLMARAGAAVNRVRQNQPAEKARHRRARQGCAALTSPAACGRTRPTH